MPSFNLAYPIARSDEVVRIYTPSNKNEGVLQPQLYIRRDKVIWGGDINLDWNKLNDDKFERKLIVGTRCRQTGENDH